jgi:hypothetical protein
MVAVASPAALAASRKKAAGNICHNRQIKHCKSLVNQLYEEYMDCFTYPMRSPLHVGVLSIHLVCCRVQT